VKEKESARRLCKPILVIYNLEEMKNDDDRKIKLKLHDIIEETLQIRY
jgi:hypothetical protein